MPVVERGSVMGCLSHESDCIVTSSKIGQFHRRRRSILLIAVTRVDMQRSHCAFWTCSHERVIEYRSFVGQPVGDLGPVPASHWIS